MAYWDKWKKALDSKTLIEYVDSIKFYKFDNEKSTISKLERGSIERVKMLKRKLDGKL